MSDLAYLERLEARLLRWAHLGKQVLSNGTRLVGRVPHVAPQAWLHEMYPPASDERRRELLATFRGQVPEAYLRLLSRMNGFMAFSGRLCIYGMRYSYERRGEAMWQPYDVHDSNTFDRVPGAPEDTFLVGAYPRAARRFALLRGSGVVIECMRDDPAPLRRWGSLGEMIGDEVDRLSALCDEEGHVRD